MGQHRAERRLAAILAADVVGYSRLMAADEKGTHARLKALRRDFIEPTISEHRGRIVKLMGDGALVEFASVVDAVECAATIQGGLAERQAELSEDQHIALRIGINIGDIIIENDDIYGGGVNIAARLEQLAEPSGICVSRTVYNHCKDKVEFGFEPAGEYQVKNIPEPVVVYRVLREPGVVAKMMGLKHAGTPKWRRWAALAAAVVFLLGVAGVAMWMQPWAPKLEPTTEAHVGLPVPDKPSIAVLPFDNLSSDPEQEYFSDGITEDLITDLSKISGLSVAARTAAFQYKGQTVDAGKVARELGVRYVLEGSVRKAEGRVRINAQLIDTATGYHQWAERFDRDLNDIFALQDEITKQITGALAVQLTEREREALAQRFTNNAEAYDLYLRAVDLYRVKNRQTVYQARELLHKAVDLDPNFSAAYARLSHNYNHGYEVGWEGPESLDRAVELAEKAVALNDSSPEAHEQLGFMYFVRNQNDLAIAEVERALALDPQFAKAYARLGEILASAGRPAETIPLVEKAMSIEPYVWPQWYQYILGLAYHMLGQYDQAIDNLTRCLAKEPEFYPALTHLASVYGQLGRTNEAEATVARLLQVDPETSLETVNKDWSYPDQAFMRRFVDGLRKAGLPEKPSASGLDKRRIAVLPFVNMSAAAENEYFSDGMTEELITQLSKIGELSVIARTSTMKYKGADKSIAEIGRELNVGTILEGSVRRAGDQVRVAAQLIDVASEAHLWAEDYDRGFEDIFAIQSAIAEQVAGNLKVALLGAERQRVEKVDTQNTDAHNLYLKALYLYNQQVGDSVPKAIENLEQAVHLDPNYAAAYAALADLSNELIYYTDIPPGEVHRKALEYAERALALDDTLARGHLALAEARMYGKGDWEGAEQAYERALELNPSFARAHHVYANMYLTALQRRVDEGLAHAKRALDLDPLNGEVRNVLGWVHYHRREYDQAITWFRANRELVPNEAWSLIGEGQSLVFLGKREEGIGQLRKAVEVSPEVDFLWGFLGWGYGKAGRLDEARQVVERLEQKAKSKTISPMTFAWAYTGMGEKDDAMDWLEKAYAERDGAIVFLRTPDFSDVLSSDPRYRALLKKMRLEG